MIEDMFSYIDQHSDKAIDELKALCRIPSVAAKGEGIDDAAEYVKSLLDEIGMKTNIHTTSGSPVVTGELDFSKKKTLLFYDHYDVQPAEPFDLWDTPPFQPDIRNGRIYARGVADNKGDIISRIWALKAFLEHEDELPINVKFVIEGEEEVSSPNLGEFVKENSEFIKADGGIWEFGGENIQGLQEAWLGLKGLLYVQLEVEKLGMDSHSANACILPSAPYRLIWALNSLKDEDDNIRIDGYYDDVRDLSEAELDTISKIDIKEEDYLKFYNISEFLKGMSGEELLKAYYNAPTCNICGIGSGWQGTGSKTVLPAKAFAKLDFRLVENMDPEMVLKKLRTHLDNNGFSDIKIAWYHGYPPAKTPVDHPFISVVNEANKEVFGHDIVVHPTNPGSGPLYLFKEFVPMVSIGIGDFGSRAHSPNESIKVENFINGTKRIISLIEKMGNW